MGKRVYWILIVSKGVVTRYKGWCHTVSKQDVSNDSTDIFVGDNDWWL